MGSPCTAQAGLKFLASDPPGLASQTAGITGVCYGAQSEIIFIPIQLRSENFYNNISITIGEKSLRIHCLKIKLDSLDTE